MKLEAPFRWWHGHMRAEIGGAHVLFTTRRGGFSSGPYTSLNLGRLTADRPECVERNRHRVETLIGLPLASIRQVHGTHIKHVSGPPTPGEPVEDADGQATRHSGLAPAVLVADCLPIVVSGGDAVSVLHAGWRGLAGGIVSGGVSSLRKPGANSELEAAIGPGARACCYQVGPEVHQRFASYGQDARRGGNLDMAAIARAQLEASGVRTIHDVALCTMCSDPSLLFSHRRDGGVTGRQAGIAWLI